MLAAVRYFGLIFLGLGFLNIQGCGVASAKPKAEAAVQVFHNQLNAGDLDAIWNGADDSFRRATSRAEYNRFIEAIHRKLGRVLKTTNTHWSVRNFNLQTSIILLQHTDFEHGSGTETFTYAVSGDSVKLVGYNIQSTDLITL